MVRDQLEARNISDPAVLRAMRTVPRHQFVPTEMQQYAYNDSALPIGLEQTISQPYIVAYMLEQLAFTGSEDVLEIGTGSGYLTALLCELAGHVISVERHQQLAERAGQHLDKLNCSNVEILVGDGSQGLPDMAPFDVIVVSAAAPSIPRVLMTQLSDQGRMILPVGDQDRQYLEKVVRAGSSWHVEQLMQVVFVPLLGKHGFIEQPQKHKHKRRA
ncbi:MAG: protein-L-isoaspartate(D-aspartate) O-methyltransferase [Anaerolineae bacterium]|nr:protein-L-isoaspartate(D-aspartate) O-methyltransferase [Anaerolineae bacterium]